MLLVPQPMWQQLHVMRTHVLQSQSSSSKDTNTCQLDIMLMSNWQNRNRSTPYAGAVAYLTVTR
jgi:hypothetical protein